MYSYASKKIIHSLVVLISVISAVYFFQSYSVIDPVDDFMSSSFGDRPVSKDEYRLAYIKEAKRQNKHLPGFYFNIVPSYFPDTLHQIILHEDRAFYKKVLRFSKNNNKTASFFNELTQPVESLSYDSTAQNVEILYAQISRTRNWNRLSPLMERLKSDPKTENYSHLISLLNSYNELSTKKQKMTFPKVIWFGCQNQFHLYIKGILTGNLGLSKSDGRTAGSKISKALKWTLSINLIAFLIAGSLGLFIGLWSLKNNGRRIENVFTSTLFFIYTMPVFWTATLLIIFFTTERYGAWTNIFPSSGIKFWYTDKSIAEQIALNASQLILPVICISLPSLAYMSRIMKSKFSEVYSSDFITTLKAKGLNQKKIYNKHVLKNGMIPYITILTGSIPGLFAGSLVIEIIFGIPGIGKLLYDSIYSSDWAILSGIVIMLSIVTIMAYLLADILYTLVNPRISLE